MTAEKILQGNIEISSDLMPVWLRPNIINGSLTDEAGASANSPSVLEVTLKWNSNVRSQKAILNYFSENKYPAPKTQLLACDPRLHTGETVRDTIRQQMLCQQNGTDLDDVKLEYEQNG